MATIPSCLRLSASRDAEPLPLAWFSVTLKMRTKNPYHLLFGPASDLGTLVVSRDDVLREIKKVRDLFLMDFDDPSIGWTGEIEVRVLNLPDIANLLLAYQTYAGSGAYPPNLDVQLAAYESDLLKDESAPVEAHVSWDGGDAVQVSGIRQTVG